MNKELSIEEIAEKELLESFAETIPPIIFGNLMERDWKLAKQCVEIAKEYADDENDKLRKENKELKEEIERLKAEVKRLVFPFNLIHY